MPGASVGGQRQSRRRLRHLYPLEADRDRRLKNWHYLLNIYKDEPLLGLKLPAMIPWAWMKAPQERFSNFLCSKDELHCG
jgi:hypothetical protein